MDFSLTDEQQLIVKTTREFVQNELYPHEKEVEETGVLRADLHRELKAKAIDAGLYAANMPVEVGGAGLDTVTWVMYEKELGRTNYALHYSCVGRPSNILLACEGEQRERYLKPTVRGERTECLAMTEPGAGSDLRSMKTSAVASGGDFIINGTKHFISGADHSDYVILFAATGEESGAHGPRKKMTAFLVDMGIPGFEVRPGYKNVSHRGYTNSILEFNNCRVPKSAILGELHRGFDVANTWLGATRLQVGGHLPGPRRACAGTVEAMGGRSGAIRAADRQVSGCELQAGGHGGRASRRGAIGARSGVEARPTDRHRHGHGDRQGQGHRDAGHGGRRGIADSWRNGPHERPAAGADLARRAHRAHMGRYQRSTAPYHFA